MRSGTRRGILIGLGIVLLGAVLYHLGGLLKHGEFHAGEMLQALRGAHLGLLLLGLAVIYACYALRALRWMRFSRHLGPVSFRNIYGMTLAGFSLVFLFGRPGEPLRPLLLARKERQPVADTFGIYALERLFDMASMAVISAVGLFLLPVHAGAEGVAGALEHAARTAGTLLFAGVFGVVVFLVYLRLHGTALLERRLQGWRAAHGWRATLAHVVLGFVRGIQTIRSWGDLAAAVVYSGTHWVLVAMAYYWVSHGFGGRLSTLTFGEATVVMAFTLVGSVVQLPAVGGGSQLGSILAYTAIFGVEREPAVVAAMAVWLVTFASCILAGVPLLIHEGLSFGELRRLAGREEEEAA
ncbi:MAG: flippase-like domain-containing protein [Acidobacteriia bacterium]|nr:flippase-like domain-containing protein [Terriglobia bacterium]